MAPKPPIVLPVADYEPDQPRYRNAASGNVMNVIRRTPSSYGPLPAPAVYSGALDARCQGAYFGLDSSASVNGFAGDASKLYRLVSGDPAWSDVSVGGGYTVAADDQWKFALYGTNVIATQIGDPVQSYVIGTSSAFADLITTADPPSARYAAVVKSFLVLANTSDAIYGGQPQRVWWSRNGDPTKFDAPGSAIAQQFQTSFQDLLGDGGHIMGIVGGLGTADGAVFMEHAIYRIVWIGGLAVFGFFPAEGVRGARAAGSIAQLGATVFYLGEDGFYRFDGSISAPIGANRVDRAFFDDWDSDYPGSVSAAIDPINKLYIVGYPGDGHTGANANKMLMYNWQLDKWSTAVPIPTGFEFIARALSFGYSLDQLYTVLGYTLETLPFSLDSSVWSGGGIELGLFDIQHRLGFFTGNALAATIDTAEVQPTPGGVTKINNARPIGDGGTPSVAVAARNRQVDDASFGAAVAMDALGQSPQRTVGRYVRARVTWPANADWTHFSGVELEGAPDGERY